MVHLIRGTLSDTNLPPERIRKLTETLTFELANLIDSRGAVEADGCTFFPNLTFMSDEDEIRHIADPAGTWMHDYALGIVDDIFDNPSA
jgi:hypothetical protein